MADVLPPLWAHQREAIERAKDRSWYALFLEQGTGKSRTMLEILGQHFLKERRVLHTLIVCPSIVIDNWAAEIAKYTNISPSKVVLLKGPGPKRLKALAKARMEHPTGFIAVTNYDAIVMVKKLYESFMDWAPEVLVCDESQRVKTHNSLRTQKMIRIGDIARYRYALSGTPILNTPMDAWAQFRFMDRGDTFGKSFFLFRAKYFYDHNSGMPKDKHFPLWKIRPNMEKEINIKLNHSASIVKKEDCLDLPPLIKQTVFVDMSPEQTQHYNAMKRDFITFLGSSVCTAQLAIVKALRLQQIVSGHIAVMHDGDAKSSILDLKTTPREIALREILADLLEKPNNKIIVWSCWRATYPLIKRICDELGVKSVEVHGDVSEPNKKLAVDEFRNNKDCRVFIGNQSAAGIGINLVEANYMIYFSRNFNLQDDLQSEARNYRGGSEMHTSVTRIDLVAKGTIDEEIQKALTNKKQIGDDLLRLVATNI